MSLERSRLRAPPAPRPVPAPVRTRTRTHARTRNYQQRPARVLQILCWKAGVTPDGQAYYFNKVTKESTFEKPEGVDFPAPRSAGSAAASSPASSRVLEAARQSARRKAEAAEARCVVDHLYACHACARAGCWRKL